MTQPLDRVLRPREVVKIVGISRSTLWRYVVAGKFPKPVKPTPSTIGWCQSDMSRWLAQRRAEAGLPEQTSA